MAVTTKEDIIARLSGIIGERNDDDALAFIEDVTNTLDDYESRVADSTDWKSKYEENDTAWREKYKSAFFEGVKDDDKDEFENDDSSKLKILTFEELFKSE